MVTAYTGNEPYIFISYSHRDMSAVLPVLDGLHNGNFRFWYDNGIEAGSEWPEYVAERMQSCNCVIAFMSKNAQDSHNCRREIHFAIEEKKPLLVVYLEDFTLSPGMRLQLGSLQAIFKNKFKSIDEFCAHLCSAMILEPCLINSSKGNESSTDISMAVPVMDSSDDSPKKTLKLFSNRKPVQDSADKDAKKAERKKDPKHLSLLSLILAVASYPLIFTYFLPIITVPVSLVLGIMGLKSSKRVMSIVSIVLDVPVLVFYLWAILSIV